MPSRPRVLITFAGDPRTDSRLTRMAASCATLCDVFVLALADTDLDWSGGDAMHFRLRCAPGPSSLRASLRWFWRAGASLLDGGRIDMALSSDLYTLPLASAIARNAHVPLIYDSRELYSDIAALTGRPVTQAFWRIIERRHLRRCALVVTVNDSIADVLRTRNGNRPVVTVRNIPSRISGPPQLHDGSPTVRSMLRLSPAVPVAVSLGGLQEGRGCMLAVRAVARIPDVHLVFLGTGPLRERIREESGRLGVAERVHILDPLPQHRLLAFIADADCSLCLIEPLGRSYRLSLPNKLFESIAAGVPVLGTDMPEIAALIREYDVGRTCAADIEAVASELRDLLRDQVRLQRHRAACHAARRHLSWEKEIAPLLSHLAAMLPKDGVPQDPTRPHV